MYRILIVEDTSSEADVLRTHLERYAAEKSLSFSVEVLSSALEFVNSRHSADLIFMDIEMPGINGMEAAEILRAYDSTTPLIFVTNLAQYAVRGYAVDALDFIVKPVDYYDFSMRMDRALRIMTRNSGRTIALPTEAGIRVLPCSDIVYINLLKHDVLYHLSDGGNPLRERGSLKAVADKLKGQLFVRISSGCLINMAHIAHIGRASVTMSDGAELFFSRSQRRAALETITNYVGRSI